MSLFRAIGNILGGGSRNGGGGGGQNPADAARPYLNQIPGTVKPYYEPFINSGREAEAMNNPIYGRMAQDPNTFLNEIMRRYSPSEGYQYKQKEASQAARNDAAAGGFLGTENSQRQQADMVRELLGQDMQQFLQNIFGIQGAGLQGNESRIERGANASGSLADILANALGSQGSLAFQGAQQNQENQRSEQAYRNQRRNNIFQNLARIGGTAAGIPGGGNFFSFGR
jgi:hypothetical protein